jgi:hypothetical protein
MGISGAGASSLRPRRRSLASPTEKSRNKTIAAIMKRRRLLSGTTALPPFRLKPWAKNPN